MYNPGGRSKALLVLFPISALVLVLLSSVVLSKKSPKTTQIHHFEVHSHLERAFSACEGTLYPEHCFSTISVLPDLTSKSLPELISAILNQTMYDIRLSSAKVTNIEKKLKIYNNTTLEEAAINDCLELFDNTLAELKVALADLAPKRLAVSKNYHDLQTFLSAAMTNQYTCLDGFAHSKGNVRSIIKKGLHNISHHVSNSLVMLNKVPRVNKSKSEVFPEYGRVKNGFPAWLSREDRKLLQASVNETKFDLIVAKDGSGTFTNITEAVAATPNNNDTRYI